MDRFLLVAVMFFAMCAFATDSLAAPGNRNRNRQANITIDCDDLDRLDSTGRIFGMFGDREHTLPASYDEAVNVHCPLFYNAEAVIRAYARKCFKPFPKQVIGLLIYGSAKQTKKRCESDDEINEFVDRSACTIGQDYEPIHRCMDKYIRQLESVRDTIEDLDLKLPYTCCHFHDLKACILREQSAYCDTASVDYVRKVIEGTVDDMLDMTCKNYEEGNPNCGKLEKLRLKPKQQAKSFMPALIDIYTNL